MGDPGVLCQPGCGCSCRGVADRQNPQRKDLQGYACSFFRRPAGIRDSSGRRQPSWRVSQSKPACEGLCPRSRSGRPEGNPLVDFRKEHDHGLVCPFSCLRPHRGNDLLVRQPGPGSEHGELGDHHGRARAIERRQTADRRQPTNDSRPRTADDRFFAPQTPLWVKPETAIEGLTLACRNSMFGKSSSTIQKQTARFCPEKRFSGTDSISGTSAEKAGGSVCLLDVMSV